MRAERLSIFRLARPRLDNLRLAASLRRIRHNAPNPSRTPCPEAPMRVVSLSVGLPREIEVEGGSVLTSIFKEPVDRKLRVTRLNFECDEQSDLTVHEGVDNAV